MPARRTTSETTFAPSSVAESGARPPMNFPMGVRTALKMTGRSMIIAPSGLVARKYKYKRRAKRGQFRRRPSRCSFVYQRLMRRVEPLFRQNRVEVCIAPLTFLHGVFEEQSFAAHAQFFHHTIRSAILRVAGTPDAVQLQFVESDVKKRAGAFGHIAMSPIFAIENVAEVASAILFVADSEFNRANHPAFAFQFDCEAHTRARPLRLSCEGTREKFPSGFTRVGPPNHQARHFGIGRIFVHVRFVFRAYLAQQQPFGLERKPAIDLPIIANGGSERQGAQNRWLSPSIRLRKTLLR